MERVTRRLSVMAVLSLALVLVLVAASTVTTFFALIAVAATSVLVMGGTGHSLATPPDTLPYVMQYVSRAVGSFVAPASTARVPTGIEGGPYNGVAVITPEQHAPKHGTMTLHQSVAEGFAALDGCIRTSACHYNQDVGSAAPSPSDSFVVFGYSQSAAIAMLEKARLAAEYSEGAGPEVSFVVIANARPNGGLTARDTTGVMGHLLFGITRDDQVIAPAPTDTQYSTVDIAVQYDGFSDFPVNPLNLLAVMNAYAGVVSLHDAYWGHRLDEPGIVDQGQYGDTTYYLIPTPVLPLLAPLHQIPVVGAALADTLDPVLRVLVEAGYDRTTSPGHPTPFNVLYLPNPITLMTNVLIAIPTGLDNGLQDVAGVRPFGTVRSGPYGVGGPTVVGPVFEDSGSAGTADIAGARGVHNVDPSDAAGGEATSGSESESAADTETGSVSAPVNLDDVTSPPAAVNDPDTGAELGADTGAESPSPSADTASKSLRRLRTEAAPGSSATSRAEGSMRGPREVHNRDSSRAKARLNRDAHQRS